jgi:hypothetical protein
MGNPNNPLCHDRCNCCTRQTRTVAHFRADPSGTHDMARAPGGVSLVDEDGREVGVLSVPGALLPDASEGVDVLAQMRAFALSTDGIALSRCAASQEHADGLAVGAATALAIAERTVAPLIAELARWHALVDRDGVPELTGKGALADVTNALDAGPEMARELIRLASHAAALRELVAADATTDAQRLQKAWAVARERVRVAGKDGDNAASEAAGTSEDDFYERGKDVTGCDV